MDLWPFLSAHDIEPMASERWKATRSFFLRLLLVALISTPHFIAVKCQALVESRSLQETSTEASLEAEAQTVRLQIVELASAQFGPSLLNDWNHPKATYPTQADTYSMAFTRLMALELAGQRLDDSAFTKIKASGTHAVGAFLFLEKALGTAMGFAIDATASAANRIPAPSPGPSNLFEVHLLEIQAIAQKVLTASDYQAYMHAVQSEDYITQTALLYKMNYEVLNSQNIVNPYVLWWCDMRGRDGITGSRPTMGFAQIAPDDSRFKPPIWKASSETQRWIAVDDALKLFFQKTSSAMLDIIQRGLLLASMKPEAEAGAGTH